MDNFELKAVMNDTFTNPLTHLERVEQSHARKINRTQRTEKASFPRACEGGAARLQHAVKVLCSYEVVVNSRIRSAAAVMSLFPTFYVEQFI